MTITATLKYSANLTAVSGGQSSSSITIASGALAIIAVGVRDYQNAPSQGVPSGSGISSVVQLESDNAVTAEWRLAVYKAHGTGVADAVDMTQVDVDESFQVSIVEFAGADLSIGAVTAGIHQSELTGYTINGDTGAIEPTALGPLQPASATYVAVQFLDGTGGGSIDPSDGWTEAHDLYNATTDAHLETSYKIAGDAAPVLHLNPTQVAGFSGFRAVLLEIRDTAVAGTASNVPAHPRRRMLPYLVR